MNQKRRKMMYIRDMTLTEYMCQGKNKEDMLAMKIEYANTTQGSKHKILQDWQMAKNPKAKIKSDQIKKTLVYIYIYIYIYIYNDPVSQLALISISLSLSLSLYLSLSLTLSLYFYLHPSYRPSLPAGLLSGILCPYRAAVGKFLLVVFFLDGFPDAR